MTSKVIGVITDKVTLLNASALTLSFMEIEALLKVVLLIFSIIYTIVKIIYNTEGNSNINNLIDQFLKNKKKKDE